MNPLWDLLVSAEAAHGDKPAVHTETRTYSFTELRRIAENIASVLRAEGLRKGDVVATVLPNAMDWFVTLAAAHEGLLSVSLHHVGQADDVDAALIVGVSERLTATTSRPVLEIDDKWLRNRESGEDRTPPRQFDSPESLVRLVMTSGTTGKSKAAEYSVATLQARIDSSEAAWGTGGQSRLNLMGFSSMGGLYSGMLHLWSGTPFVALNAITDRVPALIDEFGISVIVGATVSLAQLAAACELVPGSGKSVVRVLVAGSTPTDALISTLGSTFTNAEISIMYGSTEAGLIAARSAIAGTDPRIVGYLMPGVQLEIIDAHGHPVPSGTAGEIRYRSPELIERYYHDPVATAESLRDGWFYPGDRGVLTPTGELLINGRTHDVLNVGGNKIDPLALETKANSVPGVSDSIAYRVDTPDGQSVIEMALVVDSDETLRAVDAALRIEHGSVVPARYRRVDSVPRNDMGKLMRDEFGRNLGENS